MQPGPVVGRSEIWGAAVDEVTPAAGPRMKGEFKSLGRVRFEEIRG